MSGARAAERARGNAAGFADPREKGELENDEAEPVRGRTFTLHDASLTRDMHVAAQKVKVARRCGHPGRQLVCARLRG
jgi:hypothetical protein